MQVISLLPQKNNKTRLSLFIDDKFVAGIPLEIVVKKNLKTGDELTDKEIDLLKREGLKGLLLEKSLRLLSFRPQSEKELQSKLQKSGKVEKSILDEIISVLKTKNLVNDEEFVKWWFAERKRARPRSMYAIRMELTKKGVEREIIDKVIVEMATSDEDFCLALSLAQKKIIGRYQGLAEIDKKNKLARFLAGKGFNWDTTARVIDAVLSKE